MFQSLEKLKSLGFEGFKSVQELNDNVTSIPAKAGVYIVLNLSKTIPEFLPIGTGGYFKNKNPNKGLDYLISKWIDNTHVVYIGKAGGTDNGSTLRSRLKLYLEFGTGKPVGHYGGRLIWQIKNSSELIVCWKVVNAGDDPRQIEKQLIKDFEKQFERKPYANINS
jgi:hypothetical protein